MPGTSLVENDNFQTVTARATAVLTTSFVTGPVVNIQGCNQVVLLSNFTVGSSAGCDIKAEVSWDNTSYFQVPDQAASGATVVVTPVVYRITSTAPVPITIPVMGRWFRVVSRALTSGTSTGLTITAVKGNI